MKLPYAEQAFIPEEKITKYLLNLQHPVGRSKAQFFMRFGFSVAGWKKLAIALYNHAQEHEVSTIRHISMGTLYAIEGVLHTPSGEYPLVRSIWFVPQGEKFPRLTSAYPLREKKR